MATTVALTYNSNVTAVETLDETAVPSATSSLRRVTHSAFNTTMTLNATSTPVINTVAASVITIAAGVGSINLAAAVGTNGIAVNATGKALQVIKFQADANNAAAVVIAKGASNGWNGLGAFSIELAPGAEALIYVAETALVASDNRMFDITGTDGARLNVELVFGGALAS